MTEQPDWASQLSAAVRSLFGAKPRAIELYSVKAASSEVVEIVHSDAGGWRRRGIRIDQSSVLSARERIIDGSIDELAFDLVCIGMEEPKPEDDFVPPDDNSRCGRRLTIPSRFIAVCGRQRSRCRS